MKKVLLTISAFITIAIVSCQKQSNKTDQKLEIVTAQTSSQEMLTDDEINHANQILENETFIEYITLCNELTADFTPNSYTDNILSIDNTEGIDENLQNEYFQNISNAFGQDPTAFTEKMLLINTKFHEINTIFEITNQSIVFQTYLNNEATKK